MTWWWNPHKSDIGIPISQSNQWFKRFLPWAAIAVLALSGCATKAPEPARTIRVNVPIPIACQEPVPARPMLPVDSLPDDSDLDRIVQAMIASIERWEGYAGQLETALANCRAPFEQSGYGLRGSLAVR